MSKKSKKIDPKYIGISNICFSLTDKDDDRENVYKKQRLKRGFDDSETWSLTDTFANFMIPRLKRFMDVSYPVIKFTKKEKKRHKEFLRALELLVRDKGARIYTDEEREELRKGLKHFHKIFDGLWW